MATAPFAAQVEPDKTTDYVGNKVYENGKLKRILIDGGYIEGSAYYFFMTDHLGNNRVVADQRGTAIQTNHYYPFGMAYAENSTTEQGKQPYKYNGKELDQNHQLNMYDYSARFYEPSIGRFSTVDPHAEKYYSMSPYVYAANNPIKIIDPLGTDTIHVNPNGKPNLVEGKMIIHPGGNGNVFIQDQELNEVIIERNRPKSRNDYAGYSFSGTAIVGIGVSFNITIGVIGKDGAFIQPSLAFGYGLDVSASFVGQTGVYQGPLSPTATSMEGTSDVENFSLSFITGGQSKDQVKVFKDMKCRTPNGTVINSVPVFVDGNNWKINSHGATVGPIPFGYTNMTSYTPTTFYLYKK
ncbi:RHS repeat domain-containing protein [Prevotella sp. 10(H)]|uniref:RHS repeat domain-containing protein n=1 Tax=Prevotella sp. 10(H) TaxID=1158294 RepID=UPI00068E3F53|nr:RHS repeat-associated core domain-containing protein [Prevotella sp. 10(H)]